MKRIVIVFLIVAMALLSVSCGKSPEEKALDDLKEAIGSAFVTSERPAPIQAEPSKEIDLGKYKVTFKRTGTATDHEGKKIIHVYFDFTNNSEDTINAGQALRIHAYQDGVQLDGVSLIDDTGEHNRASKNVRSGSTIEDVRESFFQDSDDDLLIEVCEYIIFGDQPQAYEIIMPIP